MRLIIDGKTHGLKWSASHIIPGHPKCGRLHGHDYVLSLQIDIENNSQVQELLDSQGYVLDFGDVKNLAKSLIKPLDHHFLLPSNHEIITINDADYINYQGLILGQEHVCVLDLPIASSENLALYFKTHIFAGLNNLVQKLFSQGVYFNYSLSVAVFEGDGQGSWM